MLSINEVVLILKKEVMKTQSGYLEKNDEYRQMLIQAIHSCAVKFAEVASTVVHLLMDFLADNNVACAIREQLTSSTVSSRRPVVLVDGTYATQIAASETAFYSPAVAQGCSTDGNLRSLLLTGDFFLAAVVACTLAKLNLRLEEVQPSKIEVNKATNNALLIIVSMLQFGQSSVLLHPIDNDSYDRIVFCIRLLCNTGGVARRFRLNSFRESFVKMLSDKQLRETEEIRANPQIAHSQPDDLIDFYHLKSRKGMSQLELEDEVQDDLKRAPRKFVKDRDDANKLNCIIQHTGFSDPVYAEAFVTVHHYDIVLDVTIINKTKETLQNLCLELATMGDRKLVERPQNYTCCSQ
ncbi:hypothetical protein OROGR_019457 [Orobanche gracilis]